MPHEPKSIDNWLHPLQVLALLTLLLLGSVACSSPSTETVQAADTESDAESDADSGLDSDTGNDTEPVTIDPSLRIHTLRLGPSNAYLLENENGMILVDAGLVLFDSMVLQRMEEIGRDDLRLIYITHAHIDHYGGASALRRKTGAPIAIHENDAAAMAAGETHLGTIRDWEWISSFSVPVVQDVVKVEPTPADILLQDGDTLEAYGFPNAEVIFTPGHTPGSSCLLVDKTYAFVGDLASSSGGPHAQSSYASSWIRLSQSLQKMQELRPAVAYPGHGALPISASEFQQLKITIGIQEQQ